MSAPDISDLSVAYTLCCCPEQGCSRQCTVCHSPTWRAQGCVKVLYLNAFGESRDPVRYTPAGIPPHNAPGPDGVVCENGCDAWSVNPRCIQHGSKPAEAMIDMLEAQGYPLQPWQAQALRALLRRP